MIDKYIKNLSENEILNILDNGKSLTDFYKYFGIEPKKLSGNNLKEVRELALELGFDLDKYDPEKMYYKNPKLCKYCGKVLPYKKEIKRLFFCNRSCAASYNNKNRGYCVSELSRKTASKLLIDRHKKMGHKQYFCKDCGGRLKNARKYGYCRTCLNKHTDILEIINKKNSDAHKDKVKNGTHKGWQSRNITSYPEKFWVKVLDNNSFKYDKEKRVDKYFLDFVILKEDKIIDLEIDGKQHKYPERMLSDIERDKTLTDLGYFVYRIDWNEINSEDGKLKMKEKINSFIDFYNML